MPDLSGDSPDTDLNNFPEGSISAPLPLSNGRQEYHNMTAIRGSETLGGPQVEISQCYVLQFGSFTVCLHPPAGSTLDSLSSLVSALQQHAPIFSFGPNPGRWLEAQNASSVSNSGVLIPDQNPTSAPQHAMLSGPTYISNPGVQLPVPSSVSGPCTNQPVLNPSFVHYPVRQLHVPNPSIPNPSVATNSNRTVFVNSSLPPPTYPYLLHNPGVPPTPNYYVVPNSIVQPPAPNPSHLHYQISNPTPPVQPAPTIQSNIMSQSLHWTSPSSSYPRHVSNWEYMPYTGSVPQHHPINLNLIGGPRNETVILNPFPPQVANFPAQNSYLPNPQPNYYNQGPVYLYSYPTNSTVTHTTQNSYPSEFIPNPSEQNPNPHRP